MKQSLLLSLLVSILTLGAGPVEAQMFGQRNLGGTLRPRSPQALRQGPRLDVSGRRFTRSARGGNTFVGTDRADSRRFVGRNEAGAAPRVRSAVTGLPAPRSSNVNQPLRQAGPDTMYLPKIRIADELRVPDRTLAEIEFNLAGQLTNRLSNLMGSRIEVSVADRTATIRGVVSSAKDLRHAEILASFEPGVSVVQNDLRVAPDLEIDSAPIAPDSISPIPPIPPVPPVPPRTR